MYCESVQVAPGQVPPWELPNYLMQCMHLIMFMNILLLIIDVEKALMDMVKEEVKKK